MGSRQHWERRGKSSKRIFPLAWMWRGGVERARVCWCTFTLVGAMSVWAFTVGRRECVQRGGEFIGAHGWGVRGCWKDEFEGKWGAGIRQSRQGPRLTKQLQSRRLTSIAISPITFFILSIASKSFRHVSCTYKKNHVFVVCCPLCAGKR